MKWLIVNTEAFSPKGLKKRKTVSFLDLPYVVQRFLSVFPSPFIILDEFSKIKTNLPMIEEKKSSRTRLIKLLNKFGHRCILSATAMSKSPLNVVDPYNFLKDGYFPESMYELAERYCIMTTLHTKRGQRVLLGQEDYMKIRKYLKNAYVHGGEAQLMAAKSSIYRQYHIDYAKQDHIIQHRKYTPFLNEQELLRRIAPDTMFIKRSDVFDIKYEKFVKEPIMRPVELSSEAKRTANTLIDLGFTDKLTLGKAASLELVLRLQDICNGFEPIDDGTVTQNGKEKRKIAHRPLKENPKIDELMQLLEEIDVGKNQVVVWSSRKLMLRACGDTFTRAGISYVVYDGDAKDSEKEEAEKKFQECKVQVMLANQASGAYGLNCLASCSYAVVLCVDGSVEKYYQMLHRILRGQLNAPKFMYGIYAKGSIEERQWETLRVGQELIGAENKKEIFQFN